VQEIQREKSNEGFARIATTILSLEILAGGFACWSTIATGRWIALRVCRDHDLIRPKTITFIFLLPTNGIDFLRRFGECWQRWVVSDIEATIGLTGIDGFSAGGG